MIKAFDNLPKWLKVVLALPFLDILWNIYRLVKSIKKDSIVGIIFAILLITIGLVFMWLVDIITILLYDKVLWID